MQTIKMDGALYQKVVTNGAASLIVKYKEIDALNVFPVPDGDTGTNMRMTIEAGVNEITGCEINSIYEMSKKFSRGMLMGARGNSGVILSQLFRGIYKGLTNVEEAGAVEIAKAFKSGVMQAYKAVMKPVEGTILTVAREASDYAYKKVNKKSTINEYFMHHMEEAKRSLARTPDLLPVLKEAGVIDSGGAGYICIIEGMIRALNGETIEAVKSGDVPSISQTKGNFSAHSELTYGYCTEFILQLLHKKVNIATFKLGPIAEFLDSIGDSVVCVRDEDIVKVHVHTKTPGEVFNFCQQYGEFLTLKVENMSVQHSEIVEIPNPCDCDDCLEMRKTQARKKYAVVAVASGEGIAETFKAMGVDFVVQGGQTMNPSTDDFVKAFDSLNADNIVVFPNNSNIIMAANQAGRYYDKSNVMVVPSKSIAQGYSALTMFDTSSGNNELIMNEIEQIIQNVTTCLVTYSVRNTEIDGVCIHEGDFIGITNGKIITSVANQKECLFDMLQKIDLSEKEIITIIYGKGVDIDELNEIENYLANNYQDIEVDTIDGKQEVYSYILAIE